MEEFTTFFIWAAFMFGMFVGHAITVQDFNEQRQARARMRRAIRSNR